MKHMLRYHIRESLAENGIGEIKRYCQRTGCREVLLFTSSYDFQPSFIPLDQLKSYANSMAGWKKKLNDAGIVVNINLLQTLGHVNFPRSISDKFPFQRRVDWTGQEDGGGACPLDNGLREYVAEVYRIFAAIKPPIIYVDDDFRSLIGGLKCFCGAHLDRIGKLLGGPITREELTAEMLRTDTPEPNACRKAFHDTQVNGLCEMAGIIHDVVEQISPQTRIGLMVGTAPEHFWGHDFYAVAKVLAGEKNTPLLRPQINVYSESNDLRTCAGSFRQPAIIREIYGAKVDVQPEIENYTYTTYAKSSQLTFLQMVTPHLDGCHEQLLNIFDMYGSPFAESEPIVKMLEKNKGLFEQLTEIIPEGSRCSGVALWKHPKGHLYHRPRGETSNLRSLLSPSNAEQFISLLGIPVGFEWDTSPFLMLCGDDIAALKTEELKTLLGRNAVLDLPAIERVIEKGLGDMIGVRLGSPLTRDQSVAELFVDENFCDEHAGRYSPLRTQVHDGWCRCLMALKGSSLKPLSVVVNHEGKEVGTSLAAVQTAKNRRFGLLGFSVDDSVRQMFVTGRRCRQMKALFEWVAEKPLPIVAINHAFLVPQYLHGKNGEVIFAISNYSLDEADAAILETDLPLDSDVSNLSPDGTWDDARKEFSQLSPEKFMLKKPVAAFDVAIYRVKPQSS